MIFQSLDDIVSAQVPLIMPDTCIMLDIMRSPRRDSVDAASMKSAKSIVNAVKSIGSVASLVAEQVNEELNQNKANVRDDTNIALRRLQSELKKIDDWSAALGVSGRADISHGLSAVSQCEAMLSDWASASLALPTTDELTGLAHRRMMRGSTPAKQGKDSFKDCLVVETYLAVAADLRARRYTAPIVFASSNTAEFIEKPGSQLHSDIALEFKTLNITYARALHEVAHRLGLNNATKA